MKYREVERKLKALGCYEIGKKSRTRGSHRKWYNPHNKRAKVIPDHGSKDLKIGTLRDTINKLGIGWQDFNNA